MPTYAIDSTRMHMLGTGIVEAIREWDTTSDGARRPSDRQAHDEDTGMPLWGVEVIYQTTTWGRASTVTAKVAVGAAEQPTLVPFQPLRFQGLAADVRVSKAGALVETWRAESLDTPAVPEPTSGQAVSGRSRSTSATEKV